MYTIAKNTTTVWCLLALWFAVNGDKNCENTKCLKRKLPLLDNLKAPLMAEIDVRSLNSEIGKYIDDVIEDKINEVVTEQSKKVEQTLNDLKATVMQAAATEVTQKLSGFRNNLENLELKFEKSDAKVAVTACVNNGIFTLLAKIPFKDIISKTGPIDIDALEKGYFKCPSAGVYIVSFTLVSNTSSAKFYIYKNHNIVIRHYISDDDHVESGTSVVALELKVNDTVSIEPAQTFGIYFSSIGSCLTVIKIK